MTPIESIKSLDSLLAHLSKLQATITTESSRTTAQWIGLGKAGGQCDEHAASLLGKLRPALRELSRFAATCDQQIAGMEADPYGRKAS